MAACGVGTGGSQPRSRVRSRRGQGRAGRAPCGPDCARRGAVRCHRPTAQGPRARPVVRGVVHDPLPGSPGAGMLVNLEYWSRGIGLWLRGLRAPGGHGGLGPRGRALSGARPDFTCNLSCWQIGGPGECWFDDLRSERQRHRAPPDPAPHPRRPFWGLFTCYANYLHQYGKDMQAAGVHWQRQGGSATAPEQQAVAAQPRHGLRDVPRRHALAGGEGRSVLSVTISPAYLTTSAATSTRPGPRIRAWEVFNEPNTTGLDAPRLRQPA